MEHELEKVGSKHDKSFSSFNALYLNTSAGEYMSARERDPPL